MSADFSCCFNSFYFLLLYDVLLLLWQRLNACMLLWGSSIGINNKKKRVIIVFFLYSSLLLSSYCGMDDGGTLAVFLCNIMTKQTFILMYIYIFKPITILIIIIMRKTEKFMLLVRFCVSLTLTYYHDNDQQRIYFAYIYAFDTV